MDYSYVFNQNRHTISVLYYDIANICQSLNLSIASDEIALSILFNVATSRNTIIAFHSIIHILYRQIQGLQALGIDSYLILFEISTPAINLYHTLDT